MLTAEQVAEFLRQNPGFFENHVDILMNLQIPHPHGGRAVSIGERQLVAVREKAKLLEDKLRELIQFGEENDAVGEKVHRLACRLIEATSLDAALDTLYLDLLDHFAVPHVAVRLWSVAEENPRDARSSRRWPPRCASSSSRWRRPTAATTRSTRASRGSARRRAHLKSFALVRAQARRAHLRRGGARLRGPEALLSRDGHALPRAHRRAGEPCARGAS